ncbi:hypothetical protein ScPMuIL_003226 [Solemya velum]
MLSILLCMFSLLHLVTALETPGNLTAAVISPSTVRVRWSSGLKNRTGDLYYYLRYKTKGDSYNTVKVTDTTTIIRNLKPNTSYAFSVRTGRGRRLSEWTAHTSVTTQSKGNRFKEQPRNLKIRRHAKGYKIKWKPPSKPKKPIRAYRMVYKKEQQDQFNELITRTMSQVVTDLEPNTHYVFRVQSLYSGGGRGPFSPDVVFSTYHQGSDSSVKSVKLERLDTKTIAVGWEGPAEKSTGYRIQYRRVGHTDVCTVIVKPGMRSHLITNLLPGKPYKVRIATHTKNWTGKYTDWKTVKSAHVELLSTLAPVVTVPSETVTTDSPRMPTFTGLALSSDVVQLKWTPSKDDNFLAYGIQTYQDGEELFRGTITRNTSAIIESLKGGTTYTFSLRVYTTLGSSEEREEIIIRTPGASLPRVERMADVVATAGERVRLQCKGSGDPLPTMRWSREDGHDLFNRIDVVVKGPSLFLQPRVTWRNKINSTLNRVTESLLIREARQDDSGTYICTAANDVGNTTADMTLTIIADLDELTTTVLKGETTTEDFDDVTVAAPYIHEVLETEMPNITDADLFDFTTSTPDVDSTTNEQGLKVSPLLNLSVNVVSSMEAEITWDFTPFDAFPYILNLYETENGTETYTVKIIFIQNNETRSELVSNLKPQTTYLLRQAAAYADRENFEVSSVVFTTLASSPPRIISVCSLGKLKGSPRLHCVAEGDPMPKIHWTIDDLSYPLRPGFSFDLRGVVRIKTTFNITNLTTRSLLRLPYTADTHNYSCSAVNSAGSDTEVISHHVQSAKPGPVNSLEMILLNSSEIQLKWNQSEDTAIAFYNVTYEEINATMGYWFESIEVNTTSCLLSDLRPFTAYQFNIQAVSETGELGDEVSISYWPNNSQLLPPQNVTLDVINSTAIRVVWLQDNDTSNDQYEIVWRRDDITTSHVHQVERGKFEHILTGLNPGTSYTIRVGHRGDGTEDVYSEWMNASTLQIDFRQESRPPPPPSDVFLVVSDSSILAEWLPPPSEYGVLVRQYHVQVSKATTDTNRFILPADKTSVIVSGIEPGLRYTVGVRAVNNAGKSEPVIRTVILQEQGPVTNLQATATSPGSIDVSWKPPKDGIVKEYELSYSPVPGELNGTKTVSVSPHNHTYSIRYLQTFTEYTIGVRSVAGTHGSNMSWVMVRTLSATPSAPPQTVAVVVINSTAARVVWEPPPIWAQNGDLTGYKIIYKVENSRSTQTVTAPFNITSHTLRNLLPDTTYMVRMTAMTVNGTGPSTQWHRVRTYPDLQTEPEVPEGLNVTSLRRALQVRWDPPVDGRVPVQGYIVGYGRYIPEVHRFTVSATTHFFTIDQLKPATRYIVSIRAFNVHGESRADFTTVWTDDAKVKTAATDGRKTSTNRLADYTPPDENSPDIRTTDSTGSPRLLDVTSGRTHIFLKWTAASQEPETTGVSFRIRYRRKNLQEPWTAIFVDTPSIQLNNLKPGTAYVIHVLAVPGTGNSQPLELTASTSRI